MCQVTESTLCELHSVTLFGFRTNQSLFFFLSAAWVVSGERTNANVCSCILVLRDYQRNTRFVIFGLTRPELEPTICRTHCDHVNNYPFGISNLKEDQFCCNIGNIQNPADQQFLLLYWLYPEPRRALVLAVILVISRAWKIISSCCQIEYTQSLGYQQLLLLDCFYPEPVDLAVRLGICKTRKSTRSCCNIGYIHCFEDQQLLL